MVLPIFTDGEPELREVTGYKEKQTAGLWAEWSLRQVFSFQEQGLAMPSNEEVPVKAEQLPNRKAKAKVTAFGKEKALQRLGATY